MAHSTEIANEFIRRSLYNNRPLTQMQLQKLVYIAHGWNLAINGRALTQDSPQAWSYGPVYPMLWETLRNYGSGEVTRPIEVGDTISGAFSSNPEVEVSTRLNEEERAIIDRVYNDYSKFHAFQLSAMTHEIDTPWHQAYVQEGRIRGIIDDNCIQNHFTSIARSRHG